MNVFERLRCPSCRGRLTAEPDGGRTCANCGRVYAASGGVVDLGSDRTAHRSPDNQLWSRASVDGLLARVQGAAADRWPAFLGDTIALGCGQGDSIEVILASRMVRSLLVLDPSMDGLQTYRTRLAPVVPDETVAFAATDDFDGAMCDAVADTVVCFGLLSEAPDARAFLAMVHRVLKPGGRAAFVMPNRRYWQAMCAAMAEALVQLHAKQRSWPEGHAVIMEVLAQTRRLLLHRDDVAYLEDLREKYFFDVETLEDWGHEIGFGTAEALPLYPDPAGVGTARLICAEIGVPDTFAEPFSALVGTAGQICFDLLGRPDASPSILLWLTKASGPRPRVFAARSPSPASGPLSPDAAVGGAEPRWSVELLARDTPDGIVVALGGWCLCNIAVRWVRVTLDGVVQDAPVWRPRPDVHEVLNGRGLYHPMSAICSGLDSDLLFPDVHAADNACPFRLEVILANGVTVTGASPERLIMDEQMVVAH